MPVTTPPAPHPEAAGGFDLRAQVIAAYVLFLLAWMNGITAIIGVILAYVKRHEASGTIWRSHFDNVILVFWVVTIGLLLAFLTLPISLGVLIAHALVLWPPTFTLPLVFGGLVFLVLVFWSFYRTIRGLIRAIEDQPY
jgi:uncharacterized membrane protein